MQEGLQSTDRQMALELKRCCPLGRSRAGKAGRLRKGTTFSEKITKYLFRQHEVQRTQQQTRLLCRWAFFYTRYTGFVTWWNMLIQTVNPLLMSVSSDREKKIYIQIYNHFTTSWGEIIFEFHAASSRRTNNTRLLKCFKDNPVIKFSASILIS